MNVATVDTDQTEIQQDDAVTTIDPDAFGPTVTYLVKFAPGAASQGRNDTLKAAGGKSVGSIASLGIELVDFPASSAPAKSKALEKNPNIVYVAENFTRASPAPPTTLSTPTNGRCPKSVGTSPTRLSIPPVPPPSPYSTPVSTRAMKI